MKNKNKNVLTTAMTELKEDVNAFYEKHPFLTGHIIGCIVVYWVMLIASMVTGKKWDLK